MTNIEKVKHIREITFSPVNKINVALIKTNGDVEATIALLVKEKQADANDMANRVTKSSIVYSYVHNNHIGAMIVLACQTDFVAKNEKFLDLAKDICIHIVSTPTPPLFITTDDIPACTLEMIYNNCLKEFSKKPEAVIKKIQEGIVAKYKKDVCLLEQPFIKNDSITIGKLINSVSYVLGEKIEVKRFNKMIAQ